MAYIDLCKNKGFYKGQSIWSIVRRVWGKSMDLRVRRHPEGSPTWGTVLLATDDGYDVIAEIYDADGPMGIDNEGEDQDEEDF